MFDLIEKNELLSCAHAALGAYEALELCGASTQLPGFHRERARLREAIARHETPTNAAVNVESAAKLEQLASILDGLLDSEYIPDSEADDVRDAADALREYANLIERHATPQRKAVFWEWIDRNGDFIGVYDHDVPRHHVESNGYRSKPLSYALAPSPTAAPALGELATDYAWLVLMLRERADKVVTDYRKYDIKQEIDEHDVWMLRQAAAALSGVAAQGDAKP